MSAATVMMLLNLIIGQAKELYTWGKQNHGDAIPDWDEITGKFNAMQAKLDAAKKE